MTCMMVTKADNFYVITKKASHKFPVSVYIFDSLQKHSNVRYCPQLCTNVYSEIL